MDFSQQQPESTKSRVKRNWSKVRQLLIKNKNKHHVHINQDKNLYNTIYSRKNNLYNLFDKTTQLVSTQTQTLIQTKYRMEISLFPKLIQQNQSLLQTHNITFTTLTPLPCLKNILKATQNKTQHAKDNYIDTTGFWIWQAEQVMAYFIVKNYQSYIQQNKLSVIEKQRYPVNRNSCSISLQCENHFKSQQKSKSLQFNSQNNYLINFSKLNSVLQLGAGSSGLGSIVLAKIINLLSTITFPPQIKTHQNTQTQPSTIEVNITDGKMENITYLSKNIHQNFNNIFEVSRDIFELNNVILSKLQQDKNNSGQQPSLHKNKISIKAEFMLWGTEIHKKYDLVLAADCLFFQSYHNQLIKTLLLTMHQSSVGLFVNPRRGKSMEKFILLAQKHYFSTQFIHFNDKLYKCEQQKVKQYPEFDPDRHLFSFLILRKYPQSNSSQQKN